VLPLCDISEEGRWRGNTKEPNARHVVTDPKPPEEALAVQFVDGLQGDLVRDRAVRSVQVVYVELAAQGSWYK
jgi:hypothetical protein